MNQQHAVTRALHSLAKPPTTDEARRRWLELTDSLDFLETNAESDSVILLANVGHIFLHSVLAPSDRVAHPDWDDLLHWNLDPGSTWSMMSDGGTISLAEPLHHPGCTTLIGAQQIVFRRGFEGVEHRANYFDLSQPLAHTFGLHFMEEREAWCRLDRFGDLTDLVKVVRFDDAERQVKGHAVLADRKLVSSFAGLTSTTLVRLFDFTCIPETVEPGWGGHAEDREDRGPDLVFRRGRSAGPATYARGAQLIRLAADPETLKRQMWGEDEPQQYAAFIAQDFKNDRVEEISCAPDATANYFTASAKPYDTTPAFFRPEVLLKYKTDREKFDLRHRSIACRGAWSLKTFDINDEGQVHTYLCYLRTLPYPEQLHWRQFNEEPKGPISRRAFKTDFEGDWDDEPDPLRSLKARLRDLDADWWSRDRPDVERKVHYVVTTSPDEWGDELLNLDQFLIEGLRDKPLRALAGSSSAPADPALRSLGLVELCLMRQGHDADRAKAVIAPLRELKDLRNRAKGHAPGATLKAQRLALIRTHGSLRRHFQDLAERCDAAMAVIIDALSPS